MDDLNYGFHVLTPKSLESNMLNLNDREHGSWDLLLHMRSQVIGPKYDMNAYMATLFGGEAWNDFWKIFKDP